jgi:hypothetical protein
MTRGLSKEQRWVVAEKIIDWAIWLFTGLVIEQFVPGIVIAYISGILLMKTKGGD